MFIVVDFLFFFGKSVNQFNNAGISTDSCTGEINEPFKPPGLLVYRRNPGVQCGSWTSFELALIFPELHS